MIFYFLCGMIFIGLAIMLATINNVNAGHLEDNNEHWMDIGTGSMTIGLVGIILYAIF